MFFIGKVGQNSVKWFPAHLRQFTSIELFVAKAFATLALSCTGSFWVMLAFDFNVVESSNGLYSFQFD